MTINQYIKIFYFLSAILFTESSWSIAIDSKTFKSICTYDSGPKITMLTTALAESTPESFSLWISSFECLFASPLVYAVYVGNAVIVKLLIDQCKKNNINFNKFTSNTGQSLLSVATDTRQIDVINLLLKYGATVCMDYNNKSSPVHEAVKKENMNICRQLINKNSIYMIHIQDSKGLTPINYLINKKQENYVIELLEQQPVDIKNKPTDSKGNNYLHCAVSQGLYKLCEYLLNIGFNPQQKNFRGVTPIGISLYCRDDSIYKLIKNKQNENSILCCTFFHLQNDNKEDSYFSFPTPNYSYLD